MNVTNLPRQVSVGAAGTATAPANGAAIVTIAAASLPAGSYRIYVKAGYGGTSDVINGMEFRKGATLITGLYVKAVANTSDDHVFERIDLDGTQTLSVNASQAGAAATVYDAEIVATRLAP